VALALYRKYRPRTFAEVIGQEHVTEPLMQALRTGRLHHAYLFSGPRGCGKTSSARILARSLNCTKGPTPEPCGECDSCLALAPDGPGSIDVIEIDAASHGGVDDARDLRERAFFAPVASRFKVYVIDEAHMVSTQGFNALLKLVEEPPEYVKFVFATTEPERVLGTIKSRTHHYPFRLIPPGVLRPYLEKLCREEGVSVEPAVFPLVVRAGGGSARDSLSVLDQLIAGAGVFATIDRVAEAGHDPRRFASDLLERLRDLIVLQRVPDAAASGIIDGPDDQLERMATQAARMGQATLSRLADIAHNGLTEMRGTTAPRLLLELIVARMLLPGADDSHGALLQRLERMERRLGAAAESAAAPPMLPVDPPVRSQPAAPSPVQPRPAAPAASEPPAAAPVSGAPVSAVPVSAAPVSAAPAHPGALDAAAVRRVWDEVLTIVRRRSQKAWALVRDAMVRDVHGNEIVLVFQHGAHASMFGSQVELLAEALREVLGGAWQIRVEVGGDERTRGPAPASRTPAAPAPAPSATPPAAKAAPDDGGWPQTARPGSGADVPDDPPDPPARPAKAEPRGRGAAAQPAPRKAAPARRGAPARGKDTAPPADEPPFDADDDRAPYDGFDPGDEPLDDASDVRQSSEEQAIRAAGAHFTVERIESRST
jgi:DNA polymerase-3 subunit gamma/tau